MVYRIYVEKKDEFASEAESLRKEMISLFQLKNFDDLRIVNRYDVENLPENLFKYAETTVFSEPQVDNAYDKLNISDSDKVFAVEYLPVQVDQRAESAAECIQLISKGERPVVRTAKIYIMKGDLSHKDIDTIKNYVINPVEAREASLEEYDTLKTDYDIPTEVKTLDGFNNMDDEACGEFIKEYGLAMDRGDLEFCQNYFKSEHRDPTITEIKVIDTYWSDHCRHTTFNTTIDSVDRKSVV